MSKGFIRSGSGLAATATVLHLPKVDPIPVDQLEKVKLGRTAEGLQRLREQAQAEGREEGFHEGFKEGQQEAFEVTRLAMEASVEAFREALGHAAARVDERVREWYIEAEENVAALGVAIASRILGREITVSRDAITEIVRDALREVASADKVRIRVNPFDVQVIAEKKALLLSANASIRGVEIVEDPAIEGGAKIESDAGLIDATIQTQLELSYKALRRAA